VEKKKRYDYPYDLHTWVKGHTPGPWGWFGNTQFGQLYLATVKGGRVFVMDFDRWKMNGAIPRFQVRFQDTNNGIMYKAEALARYAVAPEVVGVQNLNGEVYRKDIVEIAHPDARLIAAAPDLLDACQAVLDCKSEMPQELREKVETAVQRTRPPAWVSEVQE